MYLWKEYGPQISKSFLPAHPRHRRRHIPPQPSPLNLGSRRRRWILLKEHQHPKPILKSSLSSPILNQVSAKGWMKFCIPIRNSNKNNGISCSSFSLWLFHHCLITNKVLILLFIIYQNIPKIKVTMVKIKEHWNLGELNIGQNQIIPFSNKEMKELEIEDGDADEDIDLITHVVISLILSINLYLTHEFDREKR